MNYRNSDLEMYAVVDPRIALVNDLHRAQRREPFSPRVRERASHFPWSAGTAGFLALGAAAAGLLAVGIGGGLL